LSVSWLGTTAFMQVFFLCIVSALLWKLAHPLGLRRGLADRSRWNANDRLNSKIKVGQSTNTGRMEKTRERSFGL
jgi:hypothetical protein